MFLQSESEADALLSTLTSWCTFVGCYAHDLSDSLKWNAMDFLGDAGKMRSRWVVCQSLRNAYDLLVGTLNVWMASHLVCEDSHDFYVLLCFWKMLRIGEEWLALLLHL